MEERKEWFKFDDLFEKAGSISENFTAKKENKLLTYSKKETIKRYIYAGKFDGATYISDIDRLIMIDTKNGKDKKVVTKKNTKRRELYISNRLKMVIDDWDENRFTDLFSKNVVHTESKEVFKKPTKKAIRKILEPLLNSETTTFETEEKIINRLYSREKLLFDALYDKEIK